MSDRSRSRSPVLFSVRLLGPLGYSPRRYLTKCLSGLFALLAAPRSGLALKHSIDVGAGVIDADYRGPVGVILFNHSDADFAVKPGDRIAQMIIEVIATPEVAEVEDLDATVRGEGGFGSTGV